jgi:glutaminyl-tRNA synthetase
MDAINNPEDPASGQAQSAVFPGFSILSGKISAEVRRPQVLPSGARPGDKIRYAYLITCVGLKKDPETDEVIEVHCTYDPVPRRRCPDGRKVKTTIHWVQPRMLLR